MLSCFEQRNQSTPTFKTPRRLSFSATSENFNSHRRIVNNRRESIAKNGFDQLKRKTPIKPEKRLKDMEFSFNISYAKKKPSSAKGGAPGLQKSASKGYLRSYFKAMPNHKRHLPSSSRKFLFSQIAKEKVKNRRSAREHFWQKRWQGEKNRRKGSAKDELKGIKMMKTASNSKKKSVRNDKRHHCFKRNLNLNLKPRKPKLKNTLETLISRKKQKKSKLNLVLSKNKIAKGPKIKRAYSYMQ